MELKSPSHNVPGASGKNAIDKVFAYKLDGKTYIVQPVFQPEGQDTISAILLRLMRAEIGSA